MDSAAISDIASLGFTAAKGLYDIAELIGTAGREVRVCADEIDSFAKALSRVKVKLDRPAGAAVIGDVRSLVNDAARICGRVLTPFDKLQKTLAPLLVHFCDSPGKFRQFGLRVRHVFTTKSKLLFYRDALRGQHQILNTAFEVFTFQTTKDLSSQNIQLLRLSLESSIAASHSSQGNILQEGQVLAAEWIREASYDQATENGASLADANDALSGDFESDSATLAASIYDDRLMGQQSPDIMTDDELRQFDIAVERDLGTETAQASMEIWIDTNSIRRKILRIAAETLREGQHRHLGAASPALYPLIPPERHDLDCSNISDGCDSRLSESSSEASSR